MQNWQAFLLLLILVGMALGGLAWVIESLATKKQYRVNWKDPS